MTTVRYTKALKDKAVEARQLKDQIEVLTKKYDTLTDELKQKLPQGEHAPLGLTLSTRSSTRFDKARYLLKYPGRAKDVQEFSSTSHSTLLTWKKA